jgi:hypothetical protein
VRSISYPANLIGDSSGEIDCHGARFFDGKFNHSMMLEQTYSASYTLRSYDDPWSKIVLTGNIDFIFDIDDAIPNSTIREVNVMVTASGGSRNVSVSGGATTTLTTGQYAVVRVLFFYNKVRKYTITVMN